MALGTNWIRRSSKCRHRRAASWTFSPSYPCECAITDMMLIPAADPVDCSLSARVLLNFLQRSSVRPCVRPFAAALIHHRCHLRDHPGRHAFPDTAPRLLASPLIARATARSPIFRSTKRACWLRQPAACRRNLLASEPNEASQPGRFLRRQRHQTHAPIQGERQGSCHIHETSFAWRALSCGARLSF